MPQTLTHEELRQRLINLPALESSDDGLHQDILFNTTEQLKRDLQYIQPEQSLQFEALLPRLQHAPILLSDKQRLILQEVGELSAEHEALQSITALIKKLEELQQALLAEGALNTPVSVEDLNSLIGYYQGYLYRLCHSEPSSHARKDLLEIPAQLLVEGSGAFTVSQVLARKLLCCDERGRRIIQNETGNHAVVGYGGIHFKPNHPVLRDYIEPAMEYAMYSLHELLGGEVITPTMTLKIRQVVLRGESQLSGRAVQAGLTIEGMMLKDLLRIIPAMEFLKEKLDIDFISTLDALLKEIPLQKLLQERPDLKKPTARQFLEAFCGYMLTVDKSERLADYPDWELNTAANRVNKFELLAKHPKNLLFTLGLIRAYPMLMYGQELGFLCEIPAALNFIKKLYGNNVNAAYVVEQIPLLWSKFDDENFGKLCIGSVLSNQTDLKADNVMVKIIRDTTGHAEALHIIGIDSDKGLVPALIKGDSKMPVKNNSY